MGLRETINARKAEAKKANEAALRRNKEIRTEMRRAKAEEERTRREHAKAAAKERIFKAKVERDKLRVKVLSRKAQTAKRAVIKTGHGIRATYRGYRKVQAWLKKHTKKRSRSS